MTGNPDLDLKARLILAAIESLDETDPIVVIGVGHHELRITWTDQLGCP